MFNFTAQKTFESVERSLQLLNLDYVDIIQVSYLHKLCLHLNKTKQRILIYIFYYADTRH